MKDPYTQKRLVIPCILISVVYYFFFFFIRFTKDRILFFKDKLRNLEENEKNQLMTACRAVFLKDTIELTGSSYDRGLFFRNNRNDFVIVSLCARRALSNVFNDSIFKRDWYKSLVTLYFNQLNYLVLLYFIIFLSHY